jgi:hypothetical protein
MDYDVVMTSCDSHAPHHRRRRFFDDHHYGYASVWHYVTVVSSVSFYRYYHVMLSSSAPVLRQNDYYGYDDVDCSTSCAVGHAQSSRLVRRVMMILLDDLLDEWQHEKTTFEL